MRHDSPLRYKHITIRFYDEAGHELSTAEVDAYTPAGAVYKLAGGGGNWSKAPVE